MKDKPKIIKIKITPEWEREQREYDRREFADTLLRRHEARKARRAIARNREWLEFSARLWAQ
jgi:hypothetical protein